MDAVLIALIPFPNIDPVLVSFEVFGRTFAIHWYAIAYIAGFICAWYWAKFLVRKADIWPNQQAPITAPKIEDLMTWMILGTILGGRLGHTVFYADISFVDDPLRVLRVWEGGMSFHGGFLGVVVAGWLYCKKHALDTWSVGDLIASSACFGLFFGRIANFINSELWGRPTDMPWGVVFPNDNAAICLKAIGEVCARHPSQLYEAALEGPILFAIIAFLILKRHWFVRKGQIIGVFFIGYGLARTFVEGYREADAKFITDSNPLGHVIRFGESGFTMGQTLSLPMILIGILILFYAKRRA